MGKAPKALSPQAQAWAEARKRFHLTHAQVQMARELGLNSRKLGKLANHRQELWKAPLPQFIEYLYRKRFGRERPQTVTPWSTGRDQRWGGRRRGMLPPRRTSVAALRAG